MTFEMMHRLIDQMLNYADGGPITFGFQGGEPLLAPLDFYEEFVKYAKNKNYFKSSISYTIQTNGMHITAEHAEFFKKHQFLVGISIDGPQEIHDRFRKDFQERPSYYSVIRGLSLLYKANIIPHALCVLTSASAPKVIEVYKHIKSLGIQHMQFIPVIEPMHNAPFSNPFALSQEDYSYAHKTLWDLYQKDLSEGIPVSIRYFDNLSRMMRGHSIEQCGLSGICHAQLIIESDGSVYPCDFYADDKHLLGNIMDQTINSLVRTITMKDFIIDSFNIHDDCMKCDVYPWCRGGCKREHISTLNGQHKLKYCDGVKGFLHYLKSTNDVL